MKAKMSITSVTIAQNGINAYGTAVQGPVGHNFTLVARLHVDPRTMGDLSGEGIDCPELEWRETIEWFGYAQGLNDWYYVGQNAQDMYRANPTSNTFAAWHSSCYQLATLAMNNPPAGLAAAQSDNEAKHWIAKNGFDWTIQITDVPGMGLVGGTGGGGGASLVTSDSRRRVIYFDLGFTGSNARVGCVQILETLNGNLQIHKFINQPLTKATVDDPVNLARWRQQLASPQNWLP